MSLASRRFSLPVTLQVPESEITDSRVAAYAERVRKCGLPGRVKLCLNTNPQEIPEVGDLLKLLAEKGCELCQVMFKHDFRYPAATNSSFDDALQMALKSCPVRKFWGRLSGDTLAAIPETVIDLYLGIRGEKHYSQISSELANITERLPRLDDLQIHLADHVDVSLLKPLPGVDFLYLFLSKVSDGNVEWAVKAAAAMQPVTGSQRFTALRLPQCSLTVNGFKAFLDGLKEEAVQVDGLWVSTKNISRQYHEAFTDLTQDVLGQELILLSESDIWRF